MTYKMLKFHTKMPWRTIQIGINVVSIVTGFSTFLPLSYVSKYFHWQCPLHANIRLLGLNESTIYVDRQRTVWGSNKVCMFTTFSPVTAGIHAFIWCWYYLLMKQQLKKEQLTCSDTQTLMWPNVYDDNKTHQIYAFLLTAQVSSWLQTLSVLCQTLVSGYKLYLWIVLATDGYLDIRKCGRSPSLQSDTVDSLLDDNENNSILYSTASEHIGDSADIDIHEDDNEQRIKDVTKES